MTSHAGTVNPITAQHAAADGAPQPRQVLRRAGAVLVGVLTVVCASAASANAPSSRRRSPCIPASYQAPRRRRGDDDGSGLR